MSYYYKPLTGISQGVPYPFLELQTSSIDSRERLELESGGEYLELE